MRPFGGKEKKTHVRVGKSWGSTYILDASPIFTAALVNEIGHHI